MYTVHLPSWMQLHHNAKRAKRSKAHIAVACLCSDETVFLTVSGAAYTTNPNYHYKWSYTNRITMCVCLCGVQRYKKLNRFSTSFATSVHSTWNRIMADVLKNLLNMSLVVSLDMQYNQMYQSNPIVLLPITLFIPSQLNLIHNSFEDTFFGSVCCCLNNPFLFSLSRECLQPSRFRLAVLFKQQENVETMSRINQWNIQ